MSTDTGTIIIKKIKKGGAGHHGGAWKVAFADFVTAMMAFFMLMWLLGSTTQEQRSAISNYFIDPTAPPGDGPGGHSANPVDLPGTNGILDGQGPSPFQGAAENAERPSEEKAEELARQAEKERLESLRDELEKAIAANETLAPFKDQLLLDITNEGLRIQIVDKENRAMFAQGSPVLENYAKQILHEIVKVINEVPNRISISGHTDQTPYVSKNGYSNWELSADRANAARRELLAGGLSETKIGRVVGLSSSVLFDQQNPFSPINRRISIIVMNKAAEQAVSEGEGHGEDGAPPPAMAPGDPAAATGAAPTAPSAEAASVVDTPKAGLDDEAPAPAATPAPASH